MTNTQQPQALTPAYRVGLTIPEGLHPNTATLVRDFAEAMAKKLRASEIKHGWMANWMRKDWRDELAAELLRHVHKGDPIDVAAYAAFAWFHGWSVTPAEAPATSGGQMATIIPYTDEEERPDPNMAGLVMIAIGRDGTHDHILDRIPEREALILCEAINRSAAPVRKEGEFGGIYRSAEPPADADDAERIARTVCNAIGVAFVGFTLERRIGLESLAAGYIRAALNRLGLRPIPVDGGPQG